MSGNLCFAVKAFSATPAPNTPVYWWAVSLQPLAASLATGCALSGCAALEVKHSSSSSAWVAAGDHQTGECFFSMSEPFTSAAESIDVRITAASGHVVTASAGTNARAGAGQL